MKTVTEIVEYLATKSRTKEHSLLIDLLNYCNVNGIKDVTQEKANEYYDIIKGDE